MDGKARQCMPYARTSIHICRHIPFRIRPNLSNNRNVAVRRFSHLKRRFKSDKKYAEDNKPYMEEMMEGGDAEKIPP